VNPDKYIDKTDPTKIDSTTKN